MRKVGRNNLQGFTLLELLIVLLMLTVLVSIGLLVVNLVRDKFDGLNENELSLIHLQSADMELTASFFNADTVFYTIDSKEIKTEKDVFSIDASDIYNTKEDKVVFDSIFDIELILYKSVTGKSIVKNLSFCKRFENQVLPFSYAKQYDVATRISYPFIDSLSIR